MCGGQRSADKVVPDWLWQSPGSGQTCLPAGVVRGRRSCSALPRNTIQVSYSTRSRHLAVDVQQMLLEFGVISRRYRHATGEYKVVISNRAQAELFADESDSVAPRRLKLAGILEALPGHADGPG